MSGDQFIDIDILDIDILDIDILDIGNPCNQNCRQCFYNSDIGKGDPKKEKRIVKKLMNRYSSRFFVYPKEITTSPEVLPFMKACKQKYALTNGILADDDLLNKLKKADINKLKVTLFANDKEQNEMCNTDEDNYEKIKENIKNASKNGFEIEIFNIIYSNDISSIDGICDLAYDLGANRITFLKLTPAGNARNLPRNYFLSKENVVNAIKSVEKQKIRFSKDKLMLSLGMGWGPDFYGKDPNKYLKEKKTGDWLEGEYMCPAIEGRYAGISVKDRTISRCFKLMSFDDQKIGKVNDEGEMIFNEKINDMSAENLSKNLRGICSKDNCRYQEYCLGGCRAVAYAFAKFNGEKDPIYAGMDTCRTQLKEEGLLN